MTPLKKPASSASTKKKTAARRTAAIPTRDFAAVFSALRGLLTPYEDRLAIKAPNPGYHYLESRTPTYKNRPMFFAAVRVGKSYVSYHLMPLAGSREMSDSISPELKKRRQGKACFNFTTVDQPLLQELAKLTRNGYDMFKKLKYL